jgi:signal peptide peptidase SppA
MRLERSELRAGWGGQILVVPIEGGIDDPMARFVAECAREIDSGNRPDAIILRVDSGGGGVSPSDRIWKVVQDWQAKGIPVVASFGGTAASGGYYVACSCDQIVAEPTCITGSIGVIAQMFTLQGLTDKVGIVPMTIVASGSPRKDVANDMFRTWTEQDRAVVQGILDDAYATFTKRVLDGRATQFIDLDDVRLRAWLPLLRFHWYGEPAAAAPAPLAINRATAAEMEGRLGLSPERCRRLLRERGHAPFRDLAELQQRLQLPASLVETWIGRVSFDPPRPGPARPPTAGGP